jgi:DNA/RNA-binding domain of Phe-tRNA-synthetase-like protein
MLDYAPHPLLERAAFVTNFPKPLGELDSPPELLALHRESEPESVASRALQPSLDDDQREVLRQDVRDVLRHGGHKPTGRGKPSSEYLRRAREEGKIPSINLAVDVCNAVSVHCGLPISVIDLDRGAPPFTIRVAGEESYVFNASGQEIGLRGLLCLYDAQGPIANGVKDSHGTKTSPATTRTLTVLWGPVAHATHVAETVEWYRSLLTQYGAASTTMIS